ncbi:MAG: hypothetical protein OEV93_04940 [Candidatus Moranbacteria bacterium]|nr:hypothetical protein [Candidatus Moranbacteria bacterium]
MPTYTAKIKPTDLERLEEVLSTYPANSPIVKDGKPGVQKMHFKVELIELQLCITTSIPSGFPETYFTGSIEKGLLREWHWKKST